jgi:hypothetical protein
MASSTKQIIQWVPCSGNVMGWWKKEFQVPKEDQGCHHSSVRMWLYFVKIFSPFLKPLHKESPGFFLMYFVDVHLAIGSFDI